MTVTPFPSPTEKPSRFDTLWKIWPRHEKRPLAQARYESIIRGCKTRTLDKDSGNFVEIELCATENEILQGAQAFLNTQKAAGSGAYGYKDGGKWIPHLATWLNQGRWEDLT